MVSGDVKKRQLVVNWFQNEKNVPVCSFQSLRKASQQYCHLHNEQAKDAGSLFHPAAQQHRSSFRNAYICEIQVLSGPIKDRNLVLRKKLTGLHS